MSADSAIGPVAAPQRGFGQLALQLRVSGVLAFLVLLGVVFSLLSPQFLTAQNLERHRLQCRDPGDRRGGAGASCSSPAISTSRSARSWASRPIVTADFAAQHPGIGPVLILMPLAIGGALGTINGLLVAYGRVSPLIATLGTMSLYRGLTYIYAGGQEVTSNMLPRWMIDFGRHADRRHAGARHPRRRSSSALLGALPALLSARPPHLRGRLESRRRAPFSASAPSASSSSPMSSAASSAASPGSSTRPASAR